MHKQYIRMRTFNARARARVTERERENKRKVNPYQCVRFACIVTLSSGKINRTSQAFLTHSCYKRVLTTCYVWYMNILL